MESGGKGVCTNIKQCPYAEKIMRSQIKPTDCFFDDNEERFVCCPKTEPNNTLYVETAARGVYRSKDKECWFNETYPMQCRTYSDYTTLKITEPPECPKLVKPKLQNDSNLPPPVSVILDACYTFSRASSKCIEDVHSGHVRRINHKFRPSPKIAGGDPAAPMEFPHMAILGSINKSKEDEIAWYGGGTLISEYFILTAAHALYHRDHGHVQFALMGTNNKTDVKTGELNVIVKIYRHPSHSDRTKMNDIGLVQLFKK
ncbi:venom prothrombin activator vestarin-D1-like [Battus philenor]|uniref:venom prothrombin activator vestarin-D1-like n=1 Tax=Battus philenor TaxID=42288 RepID=UPI0035CFD363